jgi:hypothetical protein
VRVKLGSGRSVVVLRAPSGGSGGKGKRHHKPKPFACAKPSGRLHGMSLGPVRLGMKRSVARSRFRRVNTRGRRDMDFFCPVHRGIRVGYASSGLLRSVSKAERRRIRGRAVLILTANRHYALHGVRVRTRLSKVSSKLHVGRRFQVGRNTWYLAPNGSSRGILKVRRGRIQEIGIANGTLTRKRAAARRFLRSFD